MTNEELRNLEKKEDMERKDADEATIEYFLREIIDEENFKLENDPEKHSPEEYHQYCSDNSSFIKDIDEKIDAELVGHAGPLIPGEVFDRRAISMPRSKKPKKVYLSKRGGIPLLRKISLAV